MTKKPLISFNEYQRSLLERGMAILADCDVEEYGGIIFNQVIEKPSCELWTSMRDKVFEVLADKFQEQHKDFKSYGPTDEEYTQRLVDEFDHEQDSRSFIGQPELEWIDCENPRNGIMARRDKDKWLLFDLQVKPSRLKALWEKELIIEDVLKQTKKVQKEIDGFLNHNYLPEMDLYDGEMAHLGWAFYHWFRTEPMYKRFMSLNMAKFLSPVFDNYKDHLIYVAAPDAAYFVIGYPYFYPIIAGERSDGSHEITIFEAYNST